MSEPLEGWFIVELMGHRRLAGYVREQTIAGVGFLRLDVPGKDGGDPIATQFVAPSSIYALTPTTEVMARRVAEASRVEPVKEWELPRRPQLPAPAAVYHDPDYPAEDDPELDEEEEDEEQR